MHLLWLCAYFLLTGAFLRSPFLFCPPNTCIFSSLFSILSEVWPEGDVFGSAEVEPEEELDLLKQILFAELPSKRIAKQTVSSFSYQPVQKEYTRMVK